MRFHQRGRCRIPNGDKSPSVIILPASTNVKENPPLKTTEIDLTADDDTTDEGRMPSFCVLLHGALKVENMAALVMISENWFGFIYSWADSKKKSNLES
ncbi:Integrator complex subunit 14, beta-barrel domain [Popillia japonica]|uniref:Integrator complex subunit 14, beta-barrel domain n=1 Tax=Popillia japonica TaxID=7064 RepID=A0AAW1K0A4_POPJA